MKVTAEIRALIERRQAGYSLEAPFYLSEEIFALDMETIFRQHWIEVATEAEIPEPGDYVTVEVSPAPEAQWTLGFIPTVRSVPGAR